MYLSTINSFVYRATVIINTLYYSVLQFSFDVLELLLINVYLLLLITQVNNLCVLISTINFCLQSHSGNALCGRSHDVLDYTHLTCLSTH